MIEVNKKIQQYLDKIQTKLSLAKGKKILEIKLLFLRAKKKTA